MNAYCVPRVRDQPGIGFTSITSVTAADYRRRIEHLAHVAEWSASNPFRLIAVTRLESAGLAALGGCHAPSTVATDATVIAQQPKVDHARDVAEAHSEGGTAF